MQASKQPKLKVDRENHTNRGENHGKLIHFLVNELCALIVFELPLLQLLIEPKIPLELT
jgi:hypothetical protein